MVDDNMSVSIFDIFKVRIGASGSQTVDPMIAACHLNGQTVDEHPIPYPFRSGEELWQMCKESGRTIADLVIENEKCWRSTYDIRAGLLVIAGALDASIARDCSAGGELDGPVRVRRRAAERYQRLSKRGEGSLRAPLLMRDWVNLYAMAVNEENAAGGRFVTAPTNGAVAAIPAVLRYYRKFVPGANVDGVVDFLLTATAIGMTYREHMLPSGAEVGLACAMAAAGLAAVPGDGACNDMGDKLGASMRSSIPSDSRKATCHAGGRQGCSLCCQSPTTAKEESRS